MTLGIAVTGAVGGGINTLVRVVPLGGFMLGAAASLEVVRRVVTVGLSSVGSLIGASQNPMKHLGLNGYDEKDSTTVRETKTAFKFYAEINPYAKMKFWNLVLTAVGLLVVGALLCNLATAVAGPFNPLLNVTLAFIKAPIIVI